MFSRWWWRTLTVAVVKRNNVLRAHRPPADGDRVLPRPIGLRYPGLAGCPLVMSEVTPASERSGWAQRQITRMVLVMKEWFPTSYTLFEPYTGVGAPYPEAFVALAPAPEVPADFAPGADAVAGVALRGPFSILTRRVDDGFELDLAHIEALTPREPFLRAGGRARFQREGPLLRTEFIAFEGQRFRPGDPGYDLVARRFLSGLNSHQTFIEHLIFCHLVTCGTFAIATHAALSTRHPLRELFQPFVVEMIRVNNDNIDGLIRTEHSNVPSYTGYPLATIEAVLTEVASRFDLRVMDPELRAKNQGTAGELGFVTVASRLELWAVFRTMADRYVARFLPRIDPETRAWCRMLDGYIPNGVLSAIGLESWETLEPRHVAYLAALCTYTSSVTHHLVADMTRDYMMAVHVMAPAIARGGHPPLGVVLEKMNSITIAGVLRYKLLDEAVPFTEPDARRLWSEFQAELRQVQRSVEQDPANRPYRLEPDRVPSSIHA